MPRLRTPSLTFIALFFAALLLAAPVRAGLAEDVEAILADKQLAKVQVGVVLARLGNGEASSRTLLERNATRLFIPASNLKLVTTAAALDRLGPDFRFRTLLARKGEDVYLIGDGDPALGDAELLAALGWEPTTAFKSLASELSRQGVTAVRNVVVDDSVFDETFIHPRWPADQAHKRYVPQVAGLNFNANCVDLFLRRVSAGAMVDYTLAPNTRYVTVRNTCVAGTENKVVLARELGGNTIVLGGEIDTANREPMSVTVHDPAMFAGTVLAETLASAGLRPSGSVVRDRTARTIMNREGKAGGWIMVGALETRLASVLSRANKDSMNLYAEALCKRLGYDAAEGREAGSWENGTAAMSSFMAAIGVPSTQFHFDDGCGLSKENRVAPAALLRVLVHAHGSAHAKAFRESLAIAGVDGTLDDRFRGSDLRGRVLAKSGYVNGVSALSGYLRGHDDEWYAFSIMMNGITSNAMAKAVQERIVAALDKVTGDASAAAR